MLQIISISNGKILTCRKLNLDWEITMTINQKPWLASIKVQKFFFDGSNYNFTTNELITSKKEGDELIYTKTVTDAKTKNLWIFELM